MHKGCLKPPSASRLLCPWPKEAVRHSGGPAMWEAKG